MESVIDKLRKKDNFCCLKGASKEDIRKAEQLLGLAFAIEYRDYLQEFSLASFRGHELTGIVKSPRLDVVIQTNIGKENNHHIPSDLYVIEVTNIDGIVIWQKSTGEVFKTILDSIPVQICKSLCDYIEEYL